MAVLATALNLSLSLLFPNVAGALKPLPNLAPFPNLDVVQLIMRCQVIFLEIVYKFRKIESSTAKTMLLPTSVNQSFQ
jgi:hypothetical protein